MESKVVKEAVDSLIKARPNSTPTGSSDVTNNLSTSLDNLQPETPPVDIRRASTKRKSVVYPGTKCNCGRCSKCVSSPSGTYCTCTVTKFPLPLL